MELRAIPGVGEKTAAALAELEDPERALRAGDVATLARAPGLSEGQAARIARAAIRERHGESGEFLATERAREVHSELLALLRERAVTDYAEKRLGTFYPSAARSRIDEVRSFVADAMEREPDPAVDGALADLAPLDPAPEVRIRDRCLATADAGRLAAARETVPELPVEVVEDARGLAELARGYSTVVAIDEAFAGVDVEGDVRVQPDALDRPAEVVPERTLAFFAANRGPIEAAVAVHRAAGLEPPCDLAELSDALSRLDEDGGVVGDAELDRLEAALSELDAAASEAGREATERLRGSIRERDVTIEGSDLLSLAERGAGVDSILSRELHGEFEAAVEAARDRVVETLDLTEDERAYVERAFPEEPTFPVEHDEEPIARLREELRASRDRRAAERKRDLAADLAAMREPVEALVRRALELDVELAVARFAEEFDCSLPSFGGEGFAIEGGRCPLLPEPVEAIEPVDYAVSGVALLSGVNSGGKTSTLDLVASVAVLAHMGLPVPADRARLERVEALAYYAKSQGTLDAGAFESTLREFDALADGGADRLVLVDELESITEPGASAKIIAGILEALDREGATAVFVSHLAGEVREVADAPLTVDGIEAVGLVDGELRVNRSPVKDHLARSTPELIVEKLADEAGSAFYERLLEKFDGGA